MKKNLSYWIVFILLFIWQLPQSLIGLTMIPFMRNKTLVADRNYCLCWKSKSMYGGISLGNFCFVSVISGRNEVDISHEIDGHTVDSKIFGILYLIVIGLPSLLNNIFDFTKCEYDFYTERWANRHANIKVNDRCRLYRD